jgi:hypothetical protein
MVELNDKQKLALYKKSQSSGYSTGILEEVYRRGYNIWDESFTGNADQFGFDRVNSFIAGGFAAELDSDLLDEGIRSLRRKDTKYKDDPRKYSNVYAKGFREPGVPSKSDLRSQGEKLLADFIAKGGKVKKEETELEEKRGLWDNIHAKRKRIKAGSGERMRKPGSEGAPTAAALKASQNEEADPCWPKYKQIGMKIKKGKKVPNCVPEEYTGTEKVSKNKNDPSSRFDGTTSYVKILAADTPGQSSLLKSVKNIVREHREFQTEATYKGKKVPLNKPMKGDVKKSKVFVDPDGDGKAQKVNFGDPNMSIKKDQPGRKRSYCARSGGQGNLNDKTSANYWSRKAWDC